MMKKMLAYLLALCLLLSFPVALTEVAENLIPGGSFEEKDPFWGLYKESGGAAELAVTDGVLRVSISDTGSVAHAVQIYCDGFSLAEGGQYRMSFTLASTVERTLEWRVQLNGGDYHAYAGDAEVAVGTQPQTYVYEFTMAESDDPAPRFCLNAGDAGRAQGLGAHELTIDDVTLVRLDAAEASESGDDGAVSLICVDQVGYRPDSAKLAVLKGGSIGSAFAVVDSDTGKSVYEGVVEPGATGGSSGDTVGYADFSAVTAEGTYTLRCEGYGESAPFTIAEAVWDDLLIASARMLYLQRCGTELPEALAGDFAHSECHTQTALIYGTRDRIEVSGGWHDAGDYGRYAVPGAKAAADLLLAYEMTPSAFGDATGIPESGNGIPDVLDEARYELEWLLKQQREDGGVYHKITGRNFDAVVMPQDCTDELYALPVSATASGDLAAVMYVAARVYADVDASFAADCLAAAERSLAYAEAHHTDEGFTNPWDVLTGEYPDEDATDEYLWALCEGYRTTGDAALAERIGAFGADLSDELGMGWIDMKGYACYAAAKSGLTGYGDALIGYADGIADVIYGEAYRSSIAEDYPWGSNMTIANNGVLLLMARELTGDERYTAAAETQLHYLLGVNTNGFCFVSGFGTDSMQHPHHRPSQTIGHAVPGMLSGGPDSGLEDPFAANVLRDRAKAACYADNDQSYSTNEVTIYWNSPLVWLVSGLK